MAHGRLTDLVRKHIIEAYVRGARTTALNVSLHRGRACFTTRRFRDRWNAIVQGRMAKKYGRSLKVKAEFTAATNPGRTICGSAAKNIRRVVRSQSLLKLHLAGQWLQDPPLPMHAAPFFMRAMLVANKDVENRFANGTQGRIVWWSPNLENVKADAISAADPEVTVRFVHEDAVASGQQQWLSGVDFIDLQPGTEEVPQARGKPNMLQLQVQPANALTIHKCQSLTIRDEVYGCLEGVFAHGQVYVLWSRVTQPHNFHLVGIPPADLLEEVGEAWRQAGLDVDECFAAAVKVSNDWEYIPSKAGSDPTQNVQSRMRAKYDHLRRVPLRLRSTDAMLDPQPTTASVLKEILHWIDEEDWASQREPSLRDQGAYNPNHILQILEETPDNWWLTEFERRTRSQSGTDAAPMPESEENHQDDASNHSCSSSTDEDMEIPEEDETSTIQKCTSSGYELKAAFQNILPNTKRPCLRKIHENATLDAPSRSMRSALERYSVTNLSPPSLPDHAWGERFFETQTQGMAQCGKHALNNVFGGPQFLPLDMEDACARVLAETGEDKASHSKVDGWYSHSVLAEACASVAGATGSRLELRPLSLHPTTIHDDRCRGAIVNINNAHWTAIVKHADLFWYVDSCTRPRRMMAGDMESLLHQHPSTFAVVSSEYEVPEMQ